MPLAEKGARGKGRQPLSPPQHTETRSARLVLRTSRDDFPTASASIEDLSSVFFVNAVSPPKATWSCLVLSAMLFDIFND